MASVVILVAVGNGSAAAVKKQFEGLGTNSITVFTGGFGGGRGGARSTAITMTMKDVEALQSKDYDGAIKSVRTDHHRPVGNGHLRRRFDLPGAGFKDRPRKSKAPAPIRPKTDGSSLRMR